MKKIIVTALSFLCIGTMHGQTNYADSLKQQLSMAKDEISSILILENLCLYYNWSIPDSALYFARQELLIAKEIKSEKFESYALNNIGGALYVIGNYPPSLDYTLQALSLAEKIKDTSSILNCTYGLGSTYRDMGDYSHARYYVSMGKQIAEAMVDKSWLVSSMGILGSIYEKSDELDSAIIYSTKATQKDSVLNGKYTQGFIQYTLGNIYDKKANYSIAILYYRRSIVLAVESRIIKDLMDSWNGIAKTFFHSNHIDSAIFYSMKTLFANKATAYPFGALEASKLLAGIYKSQHNRDSSFKYMEIASVIQDSIFNKEKINQFQAVSFSEELKNRELASAQAAYQNRIRIYALSGGVIVLIFMAFILWRNNRHKQKAYTLLQKQKQEIDNQRQKVEATLSELKATQSQLIQSEKMASLGELTAGIAHEIQNPLNFVNNFSEVSNELIDEMKDELAKGNNEDAAAIADDIKQNLEKINHHGKRADAIVKGMLQHSQASTGKKEPTNINKLADEYLRLAYHGLRAKDKNFNATLKTDYDETIGIINIIPQDIGRVLLNLYNNAFYAVNEKQKQQGDKYEPTISVSTKKIGDKVEIRVADNGNGIPQNIVDKIFQPFFTTKPTGQGTGLGLSLSYDIVKVHGGEMKVETKEGEGSKFTIQLPIK